MTTDRGSQFTSDIFKKLTETWGISTITTTPYHPEANGLVERLHRRLKESLIALGREHPNQWFWRLPCVMLAIRTTLKPDVGASPADLVFGEGLAVPGEVLPTTPPTDDQLSRLRTAALAELRIEVARLQPTATSTHRRPHIHLPAELNDCTHIFVRRGGVQPTLATPYVGPFKVITRDNLNFTVAVPGRGNEVVAISRVKPAVMEDIEDANVDPPTPPRPGRRPGIRTRQPQPTTRQTRSQRQVAEQTVGEQLQSPPASPQQPDATLLSPQPAIRVEQEERGDADAAPPAAPPMSPQPSTTAPPSSPPEVIRRSPIEPRKRLFSNPKPGNFSYRRRPDVSVIWKHLQLSPPNSKVTQSFFSDIERKK